MRQFTGGQAGRTAAASREKLGPFSILSFPRMRESRRLGRFSRIGDFTSAALDSRVRGNDRQGRGNSRYFGAAIVFISELLRSEEKTSELQSLMRISYAVICLKKNKK